MKNNMIFIVISVLVVTILTIIFAFDIVNRIKENEKKELMPDPAPVCDKYFEYPENSIIELLKIDIDACEYMIAIWYMDKNTSLNINESHYFMANYTIDINKLIDLDTTNFKDSDTYVFEILKLYSSDNPVYASFEIYKGGIIKIGNDYKLMSDTKKIDKFLKSLKYPEYMPVDYN